MGNKHELICDLCKSIKSTETSEYVIAGGEKQLTIYRLLTVNRARIIHDLNAKRL